ncbi:MAG: cell wall metabolism sensor histidine kinase WalK [Candidatus Nomurabacteria bacterium]|jgi:PAS domain S-box-containing protein|nr:cell wall metabolism sensor histidine kinase WalK [Candidatus Nomurabacteria bacterium]
MALFGKKTAGDTAASTTSSKELLATYELAVKSISDGVMVIDSSKNATLVNPAMLQIAGWGNDDAIGLNYKSILNLLDANDNQPTDVDSPIEVAFSTKKLFECKSCKVLTKHSGERVPVFLAVIPSGDNLVVTVRDITKELEEDREKTEFVSTASHEMRTPVASIEGYLGLALNPETATIDERAKAYLGKAHEASQHLGRLFQDLLDVTKLDDQHIKIDPHLTDVVALARNVFEGQAERVHEKGLNYIFLPDQNVSGERTIAPVLYAKVDQDFLRESVDNLIENATKYTPQGAIEVNVTADDNNIVLSVKDSGIGIAPEDLSHIFQKFYRADNSDTREIGGTGLGLYISRKRTEDTGGRMWAESEYQKGSTFFISIPRLSNREADELKKLEATRAAMMQGEDTQLNPFTGQVSAKAIPEASNYRPVAAPETPPAQPVSTPQAQTPAVTEAPQVT